MKPTWPFPVKDWANQFRRDDAGVDLQYAGTDPVPILAVVDGTLETAGPDPNGFGISYPLLNLDTPAMGFSAVYYGHTFPDMAKVGQHVKRGEIIGQTGGLHSQGNAYPLSNWLEIGFWIPTSGNGVNMHAWLNGSTNPPAGISGKGLGQVDIGGINDAVSRSIARNTREIARQARNFVWQEMRVRPGYTNGWRP